MKKLTATPLLIALAAVPFACGGDDDSDSGGGDGDSSTGDGDISLGDGGAGVGGEGAIGARDGGVVELSTDEANMITNASCTGWAAEGENIPAVLQFVVDVSGSMREDAPGGGGRSKWEVTHEALQEAIDALPASVAVGMLFYPNMEGDFNGATLQPKPVAECIAVDEIVDVAPLGAEDSEQRASISSSLDMAEPNFLTPTHDAYGYALNESLLPYPSSSRKFMLLITDGAPTMSQGCAAQGGNVQDMPTDPIVADVAAANAEEGVLSFIIGAPGSEESFETGTDKRPWLSEAAELGGTSKEGDCSNEGPEYCHMDMTQEPDFAESLRNGLATIAGQIIDSCTFTVPEPPPGEEINPDKTNVIVRRGTGDTVLVLPDEVGDCEEGWRFNDDGNVELCSKTCDDIKLDEAASVQLTFGCGTEEVIPVR